jgi:DNA modification methylase
MNTCITGDCRQTLRDLIAQGVKVQMCVTSPPYWGLRDYGTAKWEGGDVGCGHQPDKKSQTSTLQGGKDTQEAAKFYKELCPRCGAVRIDSQLGLEKTPEEYVQNLVEVFRLVRDVLKDDGTLWLNLGDSYAASATGSFNGGGFKDASAISGGRNMSGVETSGKMDKLKASGLKPKDLVGIPWLIAFALRADGWYLRSDIIWAKKNCMPESVTDRPTKSHEYLFLLSKNAKYFYDNEAVREAAISVGLPTAESMRGKGWHDHTRDLEEGQRFDGKSTHKKAVPENGRNLRSVWTIATAPYSEAHFATFPPALIIPCIKAGSRVGDTVLDPFFGSGTTGQVCEQLGRKWIGCELSEQYAALWKKRTAQGGLGI